jgi:acyl-CoA reductase-like NAD-dependent aldehyde dehydrogenase
MDTATSGMVMETLLDQIDRLKQKCEALEAEKAGGGAAMPCPQTSEVKDPRTGKVSYTFTNAQKGDVEAAVAKLRTNQTAWAAAPVTHRIEVLGRWKAALDVHGDEIVAALSEDTGRHEMCKTEMMALKGFIIQWTMMSPHLLGEKDYTDARNPMFKWISHKNQLVPYQVVGNISPWNYPIILAFLDTIPALVAGCSVVLKPSEITPRWVAPMLKTLEAVPELAAVFSIVQGPGATGQSVISCVDAVVFTGSNATGKKVASACSQRMVPAFLELGGNDAAVVLASADLELATDAVLRAATVSTGQSCMSIERVYVDAKIYDAFVELLVTKAKAVTLNYPDLKTGQLGPFIMEGQAAIVAKQLEDAVSKGAKVLVGGQVEHHGGGKWLNATVVTDVNHTMALMQDETFGPVVPIMPVASTEEAVRLANDSVYGLSAAVFAGTVPEAEEVAKGINAGTICINDAALQAYMMEAESEAFGESGMGRSRTGASGMLRYLRPKALLSNNMGRTRSIMDAGEKGEASS